MRVAFIIEYLNIVSDLQINLSHLGIPLRQCEFQIFIFIPPLKKPLNETVELLLDCCNGNVILCRLCERKNKNWLSRWEMDLFMPS